MFPPLTAADGRLVLAWESYRTGNGEIRTRTSLDEGLTWSGAEALTDYPDFSIYPALAGYGGRAYAVWQDDRDGSRVRDARASYLARRKKSHTTMAPSPSPSPNSRGGEQTSLL